MARKFESPSSINTYKQCPRKYYYTYITKYPTLPSIHLIRGNVAHSALEHFYDISNEHLEKLGITDYEIVYAPTLLFGKMWSTRELRLASVFRIVFISV